MRPLTLGFQTILALLLPAALAQGQQLQVLKPRFELQVLLHNKPVGTEVLRSAKGAEANYYSSEAKLKDKVNKVWREFKQRSHLQLTIAGEVSQFDRWVDVTGATQGTKLFNLGGQWRIAVTEPAFEGKKPKPKVTDITAAQPLVVLDERLPSLVFVAIERMAGKESCDYVRIDNATFGKLALSTEHVVDGKGVKYLRHRLTGDKVDAWVLRDAEDKVLAIQGLGGWSAVVGGGKVPADLKVVEAPAAAPSAAPTPTESHKAK